MGCKPAHNRAPLPSDDLPIEEERTTAVLLIPGTTIDGSYFDTMAERLAQDGYEPIVFEPPDLFTESLVLGAQRIAARVEEILAASGATHHAMTQWLFRPHPNHHPHAFPFLSHC